MGNYSLIGNITEACSVHDARNFAHAKVDPLSDIQCRILVTATCPLTGQKLPGQIPWT